MKTVILHCSNVVFRYCTREYQNQSNRMAHEKKTHPLLYTKEFVLMFK